MKESILNQIQVLEAAKNIKVLLAVENGSRAWGFASPDSDYDVRLIYAHEEDWYLSILNKKDTIEYFHDEVLDISGWDIKKALQLLNKTNASLLEWLHSPIIYKANANFLKQIKELGLKYYDPTKLLNHYKGVAFNSMKYLEDDGQIPLKKLLYVIRPLLAAKWVKEHKSIPPVVFSQLLNLLEKEDPIHQQILKLVRQKKRVKEAYMTQLDTDLHRFINNLFEELNSFKGFGAMLPRDADAFDKLLRKVVKE